MPFDDPNLLFVNAGMVQFVPYFVGPRRPRPTSAATSIQKCIRTLDIDEVGKTTPHGTFFQMNGNFSFGDYFKAEAIRLAWALSTNSIADGGFGLDGDRIWATVYLDDDEAIDLWRNQVARLPARADRAPRQEGQLLVDGHPRAVRTVAASSITIAAPITGAKGWSGGGRGPLHGVLESRVHAERAVRSGRPRRTTRSSVRTTRTRTSIPAWAWSAWPRCCRVSTTCTRLTRPVRCSPRPPPELTGKHYGEKSGHAATESDPDDVRLRVIADHVRTALMLIGDGVTPGNEGRGYVLRRIMRRAPRAGNARLLGYGDPLHCRSCCPPVAPRLHQPVLPRTRHRFRPDRRIAVAEETAFNRTLPPVHGCSTSGRCH